MTTNAGAREMAANKIGFSISKEAASDANKAMERTFSPEFRNRLDAVITFDQLPEPVIMMVVDKFISELDVLLAEKKVTIDLTAEAKKWLAEKGYSQQYGARPMSRVIQTELKRALADEILFGRLVNGGHVEVDVEGEGEGRKLSMTYTQTDRPPEANPDEAEKAEA
jgi:ATP-dependent Clp protease ATP-binding subunit ClpA